MSLAEKTPGYREIFEADAGNWEGYKLAEHTETVLRLFDDNYADKMPAATLPIMRMALLVHDVGKPVAVKNHEKEHQAAYNQVYAEDFMRKNGVDEKNQKLILAMIGEGSIYAKWRGVEHERVDKEFYDFCPEKLITVTNGITPRRWLKKANPGLSALITEKIGDAWAKELDQLELLFQYGNDKAFLKKIAAVKRENKLRLAKLIGDTMGIEINPDSIFDVQVKRLHEYKRQQHNLLRAINKYLEIKSDKLPRRPITVIFGAKACDVRAFAVLDNVFLSDPVDTYYAARNRKVFYGNYC